MDSVSVLTQQLFQTLNTQALTIAFIEDVDVILSEPFMKERQSNSALDFFKEKYNQVLRKLELITPDGNLAFQKLSDIRTYLAKVEPLHLTLAFDPSQAFLADLQNLINSSLNHEVLFAIKVDRTIVGGAVIDYKGRHLDLSLRLKLANFFEANKDAIFSRL